MEALICCDILEQKCIDHVPCSLRHLLFQKHKSKSYDQTADQSDHHVSYYVVLFFLFCHSFHPFLSYPKKVHIFI